MSHRRNKSRSRRRSTRKQRGGNNNNNNPIPTFLPPPVVRPTTPTFNAPTPIPNNWRQPRAENRYTSVAANELFPEKVDVCPPLYDPFTGELVRYPFLTQEDVKAKELEVDTPYIFAIKVSEPDKIYYYKDEIFLEVRRTEEEMRKAYAVLEQGVRGNRTTNRGWSRRVTHNCLTGNEDAICAGDFSLRNSKHIVINNGSGHYRPNPECLKYTKSLFQALGFAKVEMNPLALNV